MLFRVKKNIYRKSLRALILEVSQLIEESQCIKTLNLVLVYSKAFFSFL